MALNKIAPPNFDENTDPYIKLIPYTNGIFSDTTGGSGGSAQDNVRNIYNKAVKTMKQISNGSSSL